MLGRELRWWVVTRRLLPVILFFALVFVACGSSPSADPFVRTGADEFADLVEQAPEEGWTLIDLRTNEEIAKGYIEGAVPLDFYNPDFESQLDALHKDGHYLIYCNSGNRSGTALRMMKDLGFERVTELGGGIQAWMAAELPVVIP